jgi:hypothetical protein
MSATRFAAMATCRCSTASANSQLPGHALQIMTVSHDATPGLRVGFDYFGIELWAQTEGYGDQASAEFLRKEIDVEFDQPDGA